jgi:branched-chain amino acid transport system permease protein/urea transport system permease protein
MGTGQLVLMQVLNTGVIIGILMLVTVGLGIIYGLMDVLNLAHGEFLMVGAYGLVIAQNAGLSPWLGLIVAIILVGALGFLLERGLIRRLYRRPMDSLLATWGISLILVQVARLIFGPAPKPVATPIQGALDIFGLPFPKYRLFVLGVSIVLTVAVLIVFRYPTFGVKTRAVFQDSEMARCLGIRAPRIYSISFVIGAGLAGLAGALIAPLITVQPNMGAVFLVRAFLTVIVGGAGALIGVVGGSAVIGGIEGFVSYFSSSVMAQVITLAVAILVVRLRPNGIFVRK